MIGVVLRDRNNARMFSWVTSESLQNVLSPPVKTCKLGGCAVHSPSKFTAGEVLRKLGSTPPDSTPSSVPQEGPFFWKRDQEEALNRTRLNRTIYQISSPLTSAAHASIQCSLQLGPQLFPHLQVPPLKMMQWICNLRSWIRVAIIKEILREIDTTNELLARLGFQMVTIGRCSLDAVHLLSQYAEVVKCIPNLKSLTLFLSICPNQDYLFGRLQEFNSKSALEGFKWMSGGTYNGRDWSHYDLPTDAELVMHLFVTYMDLKLSHTPEIRLFSSQYFSRSPMLPLETDTAIIQSNWSPPYYQLVCNGKIFDLPKGSNNVFVAILLFLHDINSRYRGFLGGVNLRMTDVGMMSIVNSH